MPASASPRRQGGFTLLEAMIAVSILAIAILAFLVLRTQALIDATEARNWRIARDLAEAKLSELRAGAHEFEPESGREIEFEDYPDFRALILIGEVAISGFEAQEMDALDFADDQSARLADRLNWQQERDDLRRARQRGVSYQDYLDQVLEEEYQREKEETAPNETDLEEVAVVVFFPTVDPGDDEDATETRLILKAMVSTLAIKGMTPERAMAYAESHGLTTEESSGTTPFGASGGAAGGTPFGGGQ